MAASVHFLRLGRNAPARVSPDDACITQQDCSAHTFRISRNTLRIQYVLHIKP